MVQLVMRCGVRSCAMAGIATSADQWPGTGVAIVQLIEYGRGDGSVVTCLLMVAREEGPTSQNIETTRNNPNNKREICACLGCS